MAINDTVELAVKGTFSANDHIHTLHFRFIEPTASETDLIAEWQAACQTAYLAIFPGGHHIVKLIAARQVCGTLPLRAQVEQPVVSGSGSGTRSTATEHAAPWLASLTKERTAVAGRSRQGRFFLAGLVEADINGEAIQSSYLTPLGAYLTALMGAFGPSGSSTQYRLAVHSRKLAAVPGSQCQDTSTLVTGLLASTLLTTQKSRRSGSGL